MKYASVRTVLRDLYIDDALSIGGQTLMAILDTGSTDLVTSYLFSSSKAQLNQRHHCDSGWYLRDAPVMIANMSRLITRLRLCPEVVNRSN